MNNDLSLSLKPNGTDHSSVVHYLTVYRHYTASTFMNCEYKLKDENEGGMETRPLISKGTVLLLCITMNTNRRMNNWGGGLGTTISNQDAYLSADCTVLTLKTHPANQNMICGQMSSTVLP